MDHRLTRAEKIRIRTFDAENRSLRADVFTAIATFCQYMEAEMGVKLLLQDAVRVQVMSMCVYVTAFITYIMILTSVII